MDNIIVIYCVMLVATFAGNVAGQQRPRILEHPADAVAAREEPLTLNCKATGRPPPDIKWYHNGTPLVPSERRVVLPEGSLFFLRVMQNKREQDAGVYWCEAKSLAGVASSRNATLQIALLRDDFRLTPKDTVALVGGPVVMNCTPPRGIPEPSVLWYMNGKPLDLSGKRLSMIDQGSIIISEVQPSDAGRYECSAQSMAGSKTAPAATLKVLAPPNVVRGSQDSEVIEGEGLDLPCEVTGDPKPVVTWTRENGILPEGRSRILLDNTLRIEDVRPEDQGRYMCKAQNEGGDVLMPVMVSVYAAPSFIEAPLDVEIAEGDSFRLPCRAQGRPRVRIVWDRLGTAHSGHSAHNAALQLQQQSSLTGDDTSPYLEEESQEELLAKAKIMSLRTKRQPNATDGAAHLRTRRQTVIERSQPDVLHIPDLFVDLTAAQRNKRDQAMDLVVSEFRQIMRDVNQATFDTNFRRRRRRRRDTGAAVSDYADDDEGDDVVDDEDEEDEEEAAAAAGDVERRVPNVGPSNASNGEDDGMEISEPTPILFFSTPSPADPPRLSVSDNGELILKAVTMRDQGWYACAGLNEAGSTVKRVFVRVLSGRSLDPDYVAQTSEPMSTNRWGSEQNIIVTQVQQAGASALTVNWDTSDGVPSTQLTLHYRPVGSGQQPFRTTTAMIDAKTFVIDELRPHTEYEVFATVPHGLSGSVSNIRRGRTLDGPPTAPPTDVRVGVINITAAYVRWSPPPAEQMNGELTGYKIQIKANGTNKLLGQMSLNATTQSVVINSLSPGGRYIARVAPLTLGGLGPYSAPASLHMDPSFIARPPKSDPATGGWVSSWMSGFALAVLGICLIGGAIFAVFWARRNKRIMKASYPGPTLTATLPDKQHSLWLHGNTLLKPMHIISAPPQMSSEYAEVTQSILPKHHQHNNQHAHYQQQQQQHHHPHQHHLHHLNSAGAPPEPYATVTLQRGGGIGGAQSDDSCIKCSSASPSSSEYNAPVREPLNLCDVLPPPPDHPYGTYKPPTNMTIRTNPAAMSPQIGRRAVPPTPPRQQQQQPWGSPAAGGPPPIPTFPHNWTATATAASATAAMMPADVDNNQHVYGVGVGGGSVIMGGENDYESGSVLYEQCCRPTGPDSHADSGAPAVAGYFMRGGEPTEEYYRNINMEYLDEQDFEPSTPPPPCPDTFTRNHANLRLLGGGGSSVDSPVMHTKRNGGGGSVQQSRSNSIQMQQQQQQHQQQQQQHQQLPQMHTSGSTSTTQSVHSSDSDSETSRWAPAAVQRSRRSRSRSKSGDRKYMRTGGNGAR